MAVRAVALERPAPIETSPLQLRDLPQPVPGVHEILVRVKACGVCRTDLHVAEGDLAPKQPHIVPGHEVSARWSALDPAARAFRLESESASPG